MAKMKIKRGDTVKVIAGADNGKQGKILEIDHKAGRVKVEGVNIVKKHSKPSAGNPNGGIIEKEGFIDASNVMLVVKGKTTRVGFREENGKKVRFAKATGDKID
ncbi:MAG: 50S ribosomal protein L24 [Lachnospiraceae bacterium]|jgi:ribosomal protein L24, bacterial/organelle|nr:50S ribosomal protein L24 [Lachnospiraceae bacterium]MBR3638259.1 50S ribosomal protein L24 [Lachnospiraceae bacterium]